MKISNKNKYTIIKILWSNKLKHFFQINLQYSKNLSSLILEHKFLRCGSIINYEYSPENHHYAVAFVTTNMQLKVKK